MRRFHIVVDRPIVGPRTVIAGTGIVAEGVQFTDGTVAVRWCESPPSTAIWDDIAGMPPLDSPGASLQWID